MKFNYHFKINEEEMFEYYQYIFALTPKNKTRAIWFKLAIPILLVLSAWYFKWFKYVFVTIAVIVISFLWIMIISKRLWSAIIYKQVYVWINQNINKTAFSEVTVKFKDEIEVNGKKVSYHDLNQVLPLKQVMIFFYESNNIFLIPNRIIGDEDKMKELRDEIARRKEIDRDENKK